MYLKVISLKVLYIIKKKKEITKMMCEKVDKKVIIESSIKYIDSIEE